MTDPIVGYFAYLHSLYTVAKLHRNFVLIHFGRQHTCYLETEIFRCGMVEILQSLIRVSAH